MPLLLERFGERNAWTLTLPNTLVLISYHTPVAAYVEGIGLLRSTTTFSPTTDRQIAAWRSKHGPVAARLGEDAYRALDCFLVEQASIVALAGQADFETPVRLSAMDEHRRAEYDRRRSA
jgi:peptidoglycan hydrolase-like protein with peptidoglycan-binding domain